MIASPALNDPRPSTSIAKRTVLIAFGTQGDVQPFCLLGRALQRQGRDVTVVTLAEYGELVRSFGLACHGIEADFGSWLSDPSFNAKFHRIFASKLANVVLLRRLSREVEERLLTLLVGCLNDIRGADLVVFNPFAFFAGLLAAELSIPSVQVMCQPLLATKREPLCLFGGRQLGPFGNRMSYQALRASTVLLAGAFRRFRAVSGKGRGLRAGVDPLGVTLRTSQQVLAYSLAVSPDPGDWAIEPTVTGFWFDDPSPDARLPRAVEAFLAKGEPPIYIGLGSMFWGAQHNTAVIMEAVRLWGGRAIIARGAGGLKVPDPVADNILSVTSVDHALLFPRLAGCVHHGGAGTTARALRSGLGSIVLPMLGDQLFWGRRVAALGAGGRPLLLSKVTAPELARRLSDLVATSRYRENAHAVAAALAADPGVEAAVALIDTILAKPQAAAR